MMASPLGEHSVRHEVRLQTPTTRVFLTGLEAEYLLKPVRKKSSPKAAGQCRPFVFSVRTGRHKRKRGAGYGTKTNVRNNKNFEEC